MSNVYFRFQGHYDEPLVSADATIPRKVLDDVPDSVLAKLANRRWTSDPSTGTDRTQPIVLHPLNDPYKDEWSPALATMIEDAYKYFSAKKRSDNSSEGDQCVLKLPQGVELEDALIVLDYYGLSVDDPKSIEVPEDGSNKIIYLRAKLFLKQIAHMNHAKDFIIQKLMCAPNRVTLFMFAPRQIDVKIINDNNNLSRCKSFIKVGDDDSCDYHCEWAEEPRLRDSLVAALEGTGLSASFMSDISMLPDFISIGHSFYNALNDAADGKCWIFYERVSDEERYDLENPYRLEQLHVLRVEIPRAMKKRRIE